MSDEDEFVRITFRMPKEMHRQLMVSAAKKRSMNAEIIQRLETTFEMDNYQPVENAHEDVKPANSLSRQIADEVVRRLQEADMLKTKKSL